MRKFLISAAVTVGALTAAVPAAAQYAPPLYGNAYGQGYNNYGQVRGLQARIDNVQALVVSDGLDVSLLVMSYLGRLTRFEATRNTLRHEP